MARPLKAGTKVRWNTSQGRAKGTVVKKLTHGAKIKTHEVAASHDNPEYLVRRSPQPLSWRRELRHGPAMKDSSAQMWAWTGAIALNVAMGIGRLYRSTLSSFTVVTI